MKYQVTQAASFLHNLNVRVYEHGTLTKGKVKLFDYYKADKVTVGQKANILKWCKDARFFNTASEYAPELRSVMIAFPKAGFYKHGFNEVTQ